MRHPVLGAGHQPVLVTDDEPVRVGVSQLAGREVVDLFVFLHVHAEIREDEVRIDAPSPRQGLEALEETRAIVLRNMMDGAARIHEIEAARHRHVEHGAAQPPDGHSPLDREPLGLL